MRNINLIVLITLVPVFVSACGMQTLVDETPTPITRITAVEATPTIPEPEAATETSITPTQQAPDPTMNIPLIFQPAQEYIAQGLEIPIEEVVLASYEPAEWPDSCLGLAAPGEMCLQVITPGYLAFFDTPQGQIEVHTARSGRNFRLAPNPTLPGPGPLPGSIGGGKEVGMGGIIGQVSIGPSCPGPVRENEACQDQPYQAVITVLNERGEQVNQVQTRSDGSFTVLLSPGTYVLHPEASGAYPRAEDLEVVVKAGQLIEVQITYDSGMR